MPENPRKYRAALLHGAGYAGRELIRLLAHHPYVELAQVTSRSHAGEPYWKAHPPLRGIAEGTFAASFTETAVDVVFIAAEHRQGAGAVDALLAAGYEGAIVDLSADFRLRDVATYESVYDVEHPRADLLDSFIYGLPEVHAPYPEGTKYIGNPGCFATGISLALYPVRDLVAETPVAVTAMTGASGSGARAKATTHYPDRNGNVRAYSVLAHRHIAEVDQTLGVKGHVMFTPVSGPWTHGIWGTATLKLTAGISESDINNRFTDTFGDRRLIRLTPGALPELLPAAGSPFCDIGWTVRDGVLVIGFAIDNLLKGASSQAVQNMNLILELPETAGLLPSPSPQHIAHPEVVHV